LDTIHFLGAVDTTGKKKTGLYIADVLTETIESLGPENITQVITDSASNCQEAGNIIQERYPHISRQPCAVHAVDLFFEDIGRGVTGLKDLIAKCRKVAFYIKNHQMPLAIFREQSPDLALIIPAVTR
jgi:hypothetical protein